MKKINLLMIFVMVIGIFSCQKTMLQAKPEILTARYEIKNYSESEKGYEFFLSIDKLPEVFTVKGLVFQNKLFQNIHYTQMDESEIFIEQYFPVQSQMIQNFSAPKHDSRPDGIIFEIEGIDYFYEINFKLK